MLKIALLGSAHLSTARYTTESCTDFQWASVAERVTSYQTMHPIVHETRTPEQYLFTWAATRGAIWPFVMSLLLFLISLLSDIIQCFILKFYLAIFQVYCSSGVADHEVASSNPSQSG